MTQTRKKITGFHVTLMFIAFFGVIAAVNFLMASFALGSFSGTVVDNSYVASQKYNEWLEESRQEAAYGWVVEDIRRVGDRLHISASNAKKAPLNNTQITALAQHPVGRMDDLHLTFTETSPGQYISIETLPAGRWKLTLSIAKDGRSLNMLGEVR